MLKTDMHMSWHACTSRGLHILITISDLYNGPFINTSIAHVIHVSMGRENFLICNYAQAQGLRTWNRVLYHKGFEWLCCVFERYQFLEIWLS